MPQEIQTVVFSKENWTAERARSWLDEHDLRSDKLDENDDSLRFRQFAPERCEEGTSESLTEDMPEGVTMVACNVTQASLGITLAPDEPIRKFYVAETKRLKNGDVEGYISTEDVDRVGDIVTAAGWELDNYRKSGSPVLFGHVYTMTPAGGIPHIGNAVEMEIQTRGLWSVTRFHEKTQLSQESAVLSRAGLMPAWSVGFEPRERPTVRKDEETDEFQGYIFTKQELLEYSLVPVPANADATSRAMKLMEAGKISDRFFKLFRESPPLYATPTPQAGRGSGAECEVVRNAIDARLVKMALRARGLIDE